MIFSYCRIESINIMQAWTLANATNNKELAELCIPRIGSQFECASRNESFLRHTRADFLRLLMASNHGKYLKEEAKLKVISKWMEAQNPARNEIDRTSYFKDLITVVNLNKLSQNYMFDLAFGKVGFEFPNSCKSVLVEAWKGAQSSFTKSGSSSSAKSSRSSTQYVACLLPFLICK